MATEITQADLALEHLNQLSKVDALAEPEELNPFSREQLLFRAYALPQVFVFETRQPNPYMESLGADINTIDPKNRLFEPFCKLELPHFVDLLLEHLHHGEKLSVDLIANLMEEAHRAYREKYSAHLYDNDTDSLRALGLVYRSGNANNTLFEGRDTNKKEWRAALVGMFSLVSDGENGGVKISPLGGISTEQMRELIDAIALKIRDNSRAEMDAMIAEIHDREAATLKRTPEAPQLPSGERKRKFLNKLYSILFPNQT